MKLKLIIASLFLGIVSFGNSLLAADGPKSPELIGYCPVAYVVAGKVVKGNPDFSSTTSNGKTYWFLNADAKKAYDSNPAKFKISCDGYCAYAAAKGAVFPGDPQIFSVKDNTIYFFVNQATKAAFDADSKMAATANKNWKDLSSKSKM